MIELMKQKAGSLEGRIKLATFSRLTNRGGTAALPTPAVKLGVGG